MKPNHLVTRSNVNENQYNVLDLPKSGFDLSYQSQMDFILGRLHVGGYHHVMPGDKFSGSNDGDFTFERMVTPLVGDINVCQHNFYLPLRALDTTFEDAFAPSKHNSMSAAWSAPSFTLSAVVKYYLSTFLVVNSELNTILSATGIGSGTGQISYNDAVAKLTDISDSLVNLSSKPIVNQMYLVDVIDDYYEWFQSFRKTFTNTSTIEDLRLIVLDGLLTPLFGENSLLDTLGYNYLRRFDLIKLVGNSSVISIDTLADALDATPMCEYAIRMYYAVWYEKYRDVNLESVSANLPKWKQFGSTSVVATNPLFLCIRMRSWAKDVFTSSQIDDISRHVFAPVYDSGQYGLGSEGVVNGSNTPYDYRNAESNELRNVVSYNINYLDLDGQEKVITCPLPASINDSLVPLADRELNSTYLDLVQYRKSLNLERYLKRNMYFGDEYKDRMRAQYGSDVSDQRVNIPELLSSSIQPIKRDQQMASLSTDQTSAGDRTMTATANSTGDGYSFFSEEFGIVLNIISFLPVAQYAGVCPQNMLSKVIDFPVPVFANNNEEFSRIMEIASSGLAKSDDQKKTFGHHPYAHSWRARVNEVHGRFLSDRQDYSFRRFFGMDTTTSTPKLNYLFLHCHPNLGAFADTVRLNGQLYGSIIHNFFVERALPTPVEDI